MDTTKLTVPRLVPNRPYAEMASYPALLSTEALFSSPYLDDKEAFFAISTERDRHIKDYGFVVIAQETAEALATLLAGRRCLDAGSGSGWLSHVLAERGVDVVASDLHVKANHYHFTTIWRNDHDGDSVELLPGDFGAVLLAWPHHHGSLGHRVVTAMAPGQILVYQGEEHGGCTGDDAMHAELKNESRWLRDFEAEDALARHHLKFHTMRDAWYVYLRK